MLYVYFKKYIKFGKNSVDTLEYMCYSKKCTIMERYAFPSVLKRKKQRQSFIFIINIIHTRGETSMEKNRIRPT